MMMMVAVVSKNSDFISAKRRF